MSDITDARKFVVGLETFVKGLEGAKSLLRVLEDAEASIASRKKEVEALSLENERLSRKWEQIDADLSVRREEAAAELGRLKADIDSRKESLRGELRGLIAEVNEKRSVAGGELSLLLGQLETARSALSAAKAEYAAIQSEISSLKRKFG